MNHIVSHDEVVLVDGRQQPCPSPSACLLNSSPWQARHDSTSTDTLACNEAVGKPAFAATPSPTNQRAAPEMVSILATSSPEIESLMASSFEFLERPVSHNSLKRQTSATTVLDDKDFTTRYNNNKDMMATTMMMTMAKTPANATRHVPRVSLSPPRDAAFFSPPPSRNGSTIMKTPAAVPKDSLERSPLDDITRSLCSVRLSTHSNESSTSTTTTTTTSSSSQRSAPARRPSQLRKPSFHRRVSYDMLPSPAEIGTISPVKSGRSASMSSIPTSASPAKGRKHRRNTTVIVLSSWRK